jgi:pyruvate dehydrogenase (quinone)
MSRTVGDFVLERLRAWGVRRVFGYPGDGINGLLGALGRQLDEPAERLEFVQVRHEEEAAFMASGHARFTGEVGVCLATSGPGAIHLLNGLYDAKMDRQPVLAIVGQTARAALGGSYQQEVDLAALLKDVAGEFVQTCTTAAQARHLIDRAMRTAASRRCVTALIFPNDVQEADAVETPEHAHATVHSSTSFTRPSIVPVDEDLARAADILNRGEKVAMLVGAGAADAAQELLDVAERLQAGVAKALLGKSVLSDDLPFVTGQIGLLGTKASFQLMSECDTLLMVGSSFPYSEYLPKEGKARGVQIDIDPTMLSLRYPMECALVGDAATTLRALLPRLEPKSPGAWRQRVEEVARDWWEEEEQRAHLDAEPLNPERFFWNLSPRLPDDALISVDTGMSTTFFARAVRTRQATPIAISGSLATMGPALSYATAGKFAFPQRPAVALVGDGAMQMLGINALITVAKYWREWADPRFVVAVLNNGDLNMVTWELRGLGGTPKLPETQDVPAFDYAGYARLLGLEGLTIRGPNDVVTVIDQAMVCQRPVVIDVRADPNVIALPPHTTLEQTKKFFTAMAKGDPDRGAVLKQLAKQLTL